MKPILIFIQKILEIEEIRQFLIDKTVGLVFKTEKVKNSIANVIIDAATLNLINPELYQRIKDLSQPEARKMIADDLKNTAKDLNEFAKKLYAIIKMHGRKFFQFLKENNNEKLQPILRENSKLIERILKTTGWAQQKSVNLAAGLAEKTKHFYTESLRRWKKRKGE